MAQSHYDYDLFVIGGGSGGIRAARLAAQMGLRTALAEEYRMGGTCVIRGCVPKKLFVYASEFGHVMEDARGFGWSFENKRFDWPTLIANKDTEIARLSGIYDRNLKAAGAAAIESRAEIVGPHEVRLVKEERTVTAERILIATGGAPFVPPIPGHEHAITSNEAFHLDKLPGKILIVGGGYIALEFACIFRGLGVEVELVYRGEQILRGFDQDLRDTLTEQLKAQNLTVTCQTEISSIEKQGNGLAAHLSNGQVRQVDAVMYASGRRPNIKGLGLESLGVRLGVEGRVEINELYQTSVESIYAVGDVTNRANLTPVAIRDAVGFIEGVYKNNPRPVDLTYVPTAVFSQPEIGTVGLSEELAHAHYASVKVYKTTFRPLKHTLSGRNERTFMKLVVEGDTQKLLGCHLLGQDAAEMTQLMAVLLRMGATKADLDTTIALHPTAAEELMTMK